MGIGLTNKDSSFFTLKSKDINIENRVLNEDLISFKVIEELNKIESGSISLYDPNNFYSRIFRTGAQLELTWGYKKLRLDNLEYENIYNSDIFSKPLERRGLKVYVNSPGGSGGNNGVITFNLNFIATDMRGEKNQLWVNTGTRGDFVSSIFDKLHIEVRDINFQRGGEVLDNNTAVVQYETDFKTLVRYAFEWRAVFRMGYTSKGKLAALFLDPWLIPSSLVTKEISQNLSNVFFEYRGDIENRKNRNKNSANVISYSWQDNSGMGGVGDNVQMTIIDGKPVFTRYDAGTETVRTYRLNPERVRSEIERRPDLASQGELITEFLSVTDFEQIERFFDPIDSETAPQGTGIKTNIKTLGSPFFTVGLEAEFGYGFPDRIGKSDVKNYIRKITHSMDSKGYFCDHEIVDAYIFSPTGVRLV